jgi:RNA polymerase sigma-70 factor (ECF subfamily)
LSGKDDEAFALLVRRHGAMVLAVCRRVLDNEHDAEDAFQATFLVLARQARSIHKQESVGSFLYGVAYRISLRARADAARQRRAQDEQAKTMAENDPSVEASWRELRPILDEEVDRLPAKYRAPIVLCYLEGKTNTEAARELGWTKGTVSGRLARARELLRSRLARRGIAVTPALLLLFLSRETVTVTVSNALLTATVAAVQLTKTGALCATAATGIVSARAWAWAAAVPKAASAGRRLGPAVMKAGVAVATLLVGVLVTWQLCAAPWGSKGRNRAGACSVSCSTHDRELIQGTWVPTSDERGQPDVARGPKIVVELEEVSFLVKDRRDTWRYGIDPRAEPRWIDLMQGNQIRQGIYKLEGDTLTLCLAPPGEKRPAEFTGAAEKRYTFAVYRREASTNASR